MGDPLGSPMTGLESMKEDLCMELDPPFRESVATAEDWRQALNKVVPAVVVLRTTACRAFDTESAGASYATGFVVDKRRGIILTNRHVVKPGLLLLYFFCKLSFYLGVGKLGKCCLFNYTQKEYLFTMPMQIPFWFFKMVALNVKLVTIASLMCYKWHVGYPYCHVDAMGLQERRLCHLIRNGESYSEGLPEPI